MIQSVKVGKEIVVVSRNKVGTLSAVARVLADRGIDIVAISAQAAGGVGLMNLVVNDHVGARDLLRKKGFTIHESNAILLKVQSRPGVLRNITKKLAGRGIDILNIYASASATYGSCVLVISTDDNPKALRVLRK